MLDPVSQAFQKPVALIQHAESARGKRSGAASSKRQREKRKAGGLCTYFGCSAKPQPNRQYCSEHLRRMLKRQQKLIDERKKKGLCTYCGTRPQFWGRRCIICRQTRTKNPLPFGARRALRLYREAEKEFELELLQAHARLGIRKLLASGDVKGSHAKVLRLYAGIDRGRWRTYKEVGRLMRLTKERVRQLLEPSKNLLANVLGDKVPWKPVSGGRHSMPRAYRRRGCQNANASSRLHKPPSTKR